MGDLKWPQVVPGGPRLVQLKQSQDVLNCSKWQNMAPEGTKVASNGTRCLQGGAAEVLPGGPEQFLVLKMAVGDPMCYQLVLVGFKVFSGGLEKSQMVQSGPRRPHVVPAGPNLVQLRLAQVG